MGGKNHLLLPLKEGCEFAEESGKETGGGWKGNERRWEGLFDSG